MTQVTGEARADGRDEPERGNVPTDTFGARLMLARMHAGYLTIQQAAERCGLVDQTWSNWERGAKPRDILDVIDLISEGLGVDKVWLRDGGPLVPERRAHRLRNRSGGAVPIGRYGAAPDRPRLTGPGRRADGMAHDRPYTGHPAGRPRYEAPPPERPALPSRTYRIPRGSRRPAA